MQNFNERIYKNEALCGLIDSKIDTRLDRIEVLSKDIHNTVYHSITTERILL
jgi:hypothetical protein